MNRVIITWKERGGIRRYLIARDGVYLKSLCESLARAPRITHVRARPLLKGERVKGPDSI